MSQLTDLIAIYAQLKPSGKYLTACCPLHNEKTPSFIVDTKKETYHCFGCGAHGNKDDFSWGLAISELMHLHRCR